MTTPTSPGDFGSGRGRVGATVKGALLEDERVTPPTYCTGDRLAELEAIIDHSIKVYYVEVGNALAEIREHKLYRAQSTFEEYCRVRWDFARQTAYDYLKAAAVAENVRLAPTIP